ncbi:hypothetical protein M430DRAFT_33063 [Amorphotheca resinae ATCC 22711]|uniref:Uncharacterized protein n=1 Tax=Amorphotheca resinae ATCC 22711 TaxID=857342 RepID=A0A2T3BAE5_AMORE|nr:hypothetical protein M430DRAFT_33063 [Amorphotheca resinae ATCC 22711]PSS25302.1 hypothetical protein M430DRAFT_33063 [Amorphotheca resinae ATCC 22711]
MDDPPEVTILLLGDAEVGKSTFLSRIIKGSPGDASKESINPLRDGDQPFELDIRFHDRPYRLKFYDTASPENWTLLDPNVVVLCYDISSRPSLVNIKNRWIKETHRAFGHRSDLPILLLGLKRDLRSKTDPNGTIHLEEAYRIAQETRCDKYMECSAMTGELLHVAFGDLCRTAAMTTTAKGGLSDGGCLVM